MLLKLAEKGDAKSAFDLSILLTSGLVSVASIDEQRVLSLRWLRASARGGWLPAMQRLSDIYKWGWMELKPDPDLSDCFHKASISKEAQIAVYGCLDVKNEKGSSAPNTPSVDKQ
ncbi:hypothetical protein [Bradyrhizobium sp. SZCCHNPS1003]|uniref:hypothetical protein n=1 Tax=Bradyrhizobium sp. SZCCHNPS1003 TaxID=3057330 RepID=UPI0028E8DCF0|nr:hypothetical protein [Bradyrhizobium sp. SZCCHNPS1003]